MNVTIETAQCAPVSTPWGTSIDRAVYTDAIHFYSTPSHGGFRVTGAALDLIPPAWRAYAKRWGGSESWYEEDCAWAAVALTFPDLFEADEVAFARRIAAQFLPALNSVAA